MATNSKLWQIANDMRGRGEIDLVKVLEEAQERGISVGINMLCELPDAMLRGMWVVPDGLVDSVVAICRHIAPKSVLDPFAGAGQLIISLADALKPEQSVAIVANPRDAALGRLFEQEKDIEWLVGTPIQELDRVGTFDAIVSCPPFGMGGPVREISIGGTTIHDDYGNLIVAKACVEHLGKAGMGLFVLPPSFIFKTAPSNLRAVLSPLGLHLSALIHLPYGFFSSTRIDSYLAVIDRTEHSNLFVAQLSNDKNHNRLVVENLLKRKPGSDLAMGVLSDHAFAGYRALESRQRTNKLAVRMGVPPTPMSEVAREINLTKSSDPKAFPERDNAVYVPLIGKSAVRTSSDDLSMKAHNYAQIVLDADKAIATYVAGYLNSALGRMILEGVESGSFIPKRTKGALESCEIHLLSIDEQLACVQADSRALNVLSEVSSLRANIWDRPRALKKTLQELKNINREDTLATWIENLPFPLGSVLWAYHACGDDDRARNAALLQFFEALAEFYGIVMWSASVNTPAIFEDSRFPISPGKPFKNSFSKSTFGAWVELVERLSIFGRTLLNGKSEDKEIIFEAYATRDVAVLGNIFSSDLISQMQSTNHLRNNASHGGAVGDREAKRRRVELEQALAKVRNHVGDVWLQYQLFKADRARLKDRMWRYEVERIMGRAPPFERTTVALSDGVEDGHLFLRAAESTAALPLLPLVIVGPSPEETLNACYFYDKLDGSEMAFKSYHFAERAEIRSTDAEAKKVVSYLIDQTGNREG